MAKIRVTANNNERKAVYVADDGKETDISNAISAIRCGAIVADKPIEATVLCQDIEIDGIDIDTKNIILDIKKTQELKYKENE